MIKSEIDLIGKTEHFVKQTLEGAEAGHDWYHIARVRAMANKILEIESGDPLVVELAALLHDIADAKFHDGDDSVGPKVARKFLDGENVDNEIKEHVISIIEHISWKGGEKSSFSTIEFQIVQDADRLDALGAIGIARAFNYGGYKGQPMYDPEIPVKTNMTKEEYRKGKTTSLNHFYEKLFLLPERLHTKAAKKIADDRVTYMEEFVDRFKSEWEGNGIF